MYTGSNRLKIMGLSFVTMMLALTMFYYGLSVRLVDVSYFLSWEMVMVGTASVGLSFVFDWNSFIFSFVVLSISASVIYYSLSYMESEVYFMRFMMIMVSFVLSMVILIFSSNLMGMLIGWDGLGISSYFLVIYYQSKSSLSAGMITAFTNRLGDVGVVIMIGMLSSMGMWNFVVLTQVGYFYQVNSFLFLMFLVASTKSAQIPFSSWLPAAMAAPTPVSSLVHSSTLVTAGVYLVMRFYNLYWSKEFMFFMMFVGLITSFVSVVAAVSEPDFKKVIALSTLSHMGFIFIVIGFFSIDISFLHLCMHAFFKAMLFLTVGLSIHMSSGYQSFKKVSSNFQSSPGGTVMMIVAISSMSGLPMLSGFYSKDLSLDFFTFFPGTSIIVWIFSFFTALMSMVYAIRMLKFVCFSSDKMLSLVWVSSNLQYYHKSTLFLYLMSLVLASRFLFVNFTASGLFFFHGSLKMIIPVIMVGWSVYALKKFSTGVFSMNFFLENSMSMLYMYYMSFYLAEKVMSLMKLYIEEDKKWVSKVSLKVYDFWWGVFIWGNLFSMKFMNAFFCSGLIYVGVWMF